MNKLIILLTCLVTAITPISNNSTATEKNNTKHIMVQEPLRPFFNEFVDIVQKNNLEVDWSKIKNIDLIPLGENIQGYWSKNSSTVIINIYHKFPNNRNVTEEEKEDLVLLTLAHEIGHSQGWVHSDSDFITLMNPTSQYDLMVVRGIGIEHYIVQSFNYQNKQ